MIKTFYVDSTDGSYLVEHGLRQIKCPSCGNGFLPDNKRGWAATEVAVFSCLMQDGSTQEHVVHVGCTEAYKQVLERKLNESITARVVG